jgi:hypothetical protein
MSENKTTPLPIKVNQIMRDGGRSQVAIALEEMNNKQKQDFAKIMSEDGPARTLAIQLTNLERYSSLTDDNPDRGIILQSKNESYVRVEKADVRTQEFIKDAFEFREYIQGSKAFKRLGKKATKRLLNFIGEGESAVTTSRYLITQVIKTRDYENEALMLEKAEGLKDLAEKSDVTPNEADDTIELSDSTESLKDLIVNSNVVRDKKEALEDILPTSEK